MSTRMEKKERRQFTAEYRAEAVRQALLGDRTLTQVARDLGIPLQRVSTWVHKARAEGDQGDLTAAERDELKQLRREVARLREEREILKKATAFFAKENK